MPTDSKSIRDECIAGLPNERERLDSTLYDLEFYHGDFSRWPIRPPGASSDARRWPRFSLLAQKAVHVLCENLYKSGPSRTLKDHDAASEWLSGIYRTNCVDAQWQEADRLTVASRVALWHVRTSEDPARPIRLQLWDSSQFAVWLDPEDQLEPIAVALLDKFDNQRRIRLWDAETVTTFLTKKLEPKQTAGAVAYTLQGRKPNPAGRLPFAFAHFDMPITDFWTPSPGANLREINDGINKQLTDSFDRVRFSLNPVIVLKGVRAGWRPPSPVQPGDMWDLPGGADAAGEGEADQSAEYLQADASFIAASWDDLQAYLDHTLEMHGIPAAAIRMEQTAARSGVSIVAEQIPLINWAESRQRPFSYYEDKLAKLVLEIGASHLGSQDDAEYVATAGDLEEAAAEPNLTLRWPDLYPNLPGPDRDAADQWLLDNGLASRTLILMRRDKLTREEAEAKLEEVAEDLKWEQEMLAAAEPAPDPNDPNAVQPGDPAMTQQEGDTAGDDEANEKDE